MTETADLTEYRQARFVAPAGATTILLIRHGESAAARADQPFDVVDGHGDPPLHDEGRRQADAVGRRLVNAPISAIYVTTLRRTAQTAAPLAGLLGLEPAVEPDLREVYLGEWEGERYRQHMQERHPIALKVFAEERWDAIPGAEPPEAFTARVKAGIGRVAAAHPDQLVAVFTHGGVIGAALALAAGSRPFAFVGADNASISELVISPARWTVRRYNDTSHLEALAAEEARRRLA
jgi:2,3-bisphosphoglycerate-dependent phosphoglycerate mutase